MDIIEEAGKLNKSIRESEVFKQYIYTKNALKANDDLYYRYVDFQRKNSWIQNSGSENIYDEMMQLSYENDELLHNSLVSDYIRAENRLQRLMREVLRELMKEIEFEYID